MCTLLSRFEAFEAVAYWKQALMQLDEMHDAFLEPTVITYDAGITACQQAARCALWTVSKIVR